MNKDAIQKIIEETLMSGKKYPNLLQLPKILGIKSDLESAESTEEVVQILEANRKSILKAFDLDESRYAEGINSILNLKA